MGGGGSQAVTTMSSPEAGAPSAIVQMAKSPNPFAAIHNAEPPSFPGPMFSGLNAIVNPFSGLNATVNPFSTSRPSSAAAVTRSAPAATDAADTHAATTTAAASATATATTGAKPLPAATAAAPSSGAPATATLAVPTGVAAQPPPSTSATAVTAGVPEMTCCPLSQVANTLEMLSTDVLSQPSTTAPAQPTPAVPAGDLSLSLQPATEAAKAAGAAAAAAPAAGVAIMGTAPLLADTSAALSQTQAADSAAVPVRNASKRKWDAMTRPETGSVTVLAAAAPVAPAPSSSAAATINSTAAPTGAVTATTLTPPALPAATAQALPAGAERPLAAAQHNAPQRATAAILAAAVIPVAVTSSSPVAAPAQPAAAAAADSSQLHLSVQSEPAGSHLSRAPQCMPVSAAAQLSIVPGTMPIPAHPAALPKNPSFQSVSASETSQPQPASQALEAASKHIEAASKAVTGKEMAAKLAAGFAEQHRSGLSLTARTVPTNTVSSGVPAPINLSEAVQIAAAAAAEKLIRDQASKARLSVQSSGDTHAARMEAIRLRNLARHDVPEPIALPPPPPHPDTTAVAAVDRPQPAAQASAAADQSQNSSRTSSKGKSKARKKRGRELPQVPWETEQTPGLTGNPGELAAPGAGGRRRTDSPASGDTWDTVRQQAHSPGKPQVSFVIISSVAMMGMYDKICSTAQDSQWGSASL